MTDQEIKTIQEKLGPEFEVKRMNGSVVVDAVDIWENIGFAECLENNNYQFTKGKVYPVNEITDNNILVSHDDRGNTNGWAKYLFIPSTEQAYKDQLIKEAKERFGEINDGDRFDCSSIGFGDSLMTIHKAPNSTFSYFKERDEFYLGGFMLYKQGEWAEKIENQDITMDWITFGLRDIPGGHEFDLSLKIYGSTYCKLLSDDTKNHILQSLYEYLSKK